MKPTRIFLPPHQIRAALADRLGAISVPFAEQPPEGSCPLKAADGSGDVKFFTRHMGGIGLSRTPWLSPPWAPGEVLWVAEAWATEKRFDWTQPRYLPRRYPPGDAACGMDYATIWYSDELDQKKQFQRGAELAGRTRLSVHMPRALSRITLTVGEPRACRLLDATEEEAKEEAVLPFDTLTPDDLMTTSDEPVRMMLLRAAWNYQWPKHPSAGNPWRWRAPVTVEVMRCG